MLGVFRLTGAYPVGVSQLYAQGLAGGVPDRDAAEAALLAAGSGDGGAAGVLRAAAFVG